MNYKTKQSKVSKWRMLFMPIVWILEAIIWVFKPRLYKVGTDIDKDFAKHLISYGGGKLVVLKRK